MAKFIAIASLLAMVSSSTAHAAEDSPEIPDAVLAAAEKASVSPADLLGATITTGLEPLEYLYQTDELQRPERPPPGLVGAVAQADCLIQKESHGLDVPNAQGSGAWGPGQYFSGTWAWHVGLYRAATGYGGPLSMHALSDVRRVMALMLTMPGMRAHWTVSGC